jgi:Flp pilus assembly pilin Flp
MAHLMRKLWRDDCGALISSEFLFVATILVIGVIVGLTNVRAGLNAELTALGNAFLTLSQGFAISGQSGTYSTTDGSQAFDTPGLLTPPTPTAPVSVQDISVSVN